MDAKELMIGDWVRYEKNYPDKKLGGIIARVLGISNFIMVRTTGEKYNDVNSDWLEPIPLTSKILEKNGFTYYGESWYIPYDDKNKSESIMVGFHMYCTEINITKGNNVCYRKEIPCKYRSCAENRHVYVHELQHALRLCGLGNLADNFQV